MSVESLSIKGLFEPEHQSRWPNLGPIAILLSILPIAILLSILPSILPIAILLSILPSILPSFRSPILKSHSRVPFSRARQRVEDICCDRPCVGFIPAAVRGLGEERRRTTEAASPALRGGVVGVERRRRRRREAASFKRLSLQPSNEFFLHRVA